MKASGGKGAVMRRPLNINIAILTGTILVPFVVAAGFLADRFDAPANGPALAMWPELRGTFDDAAGSAAAPARMDGLGLKP